MTIADFFTNFENLSVCRFFGEEFVEICYRSEWSKAKKTAGGCINYDTVGQNPQLQMTVTGSEPVEFFAFLQVENNAGEEQEEIGIGFQIYDLKGKKVMNRRTPEAIMENSRGYLVASSVYLDSKIKPNPTPYTLNMTTFDQGVQAKFSFTLWYKKSQGTIALNEF